MVLKGHSHGKVVEMTSLYHRFGPNQGMAMIFKFLKSPIKKLRLFMWGCKIGSLDLQEVAAARTQTLLEKIYGWYSSNKEFKSNKQSHKIKINQNL
jgi:hypothetical protein